jgi:hypothetical protein
MRTLAIELRTLLSSWPSLIPDRHGGDLIESPKPLSSARNFC